MKEFRIHDLPDCKLTFNCFLWYTLHGVDYERCINRSGYSEVYTEYNDNMTHTVYLDVNGNPVSSNTNGYAEMYIEYGEFGGIRQETHRIYLDVNGNPVNATRFGYAEMYTEYDENGNRISRIKYDAEGQIIE